MAHMITASDAAFFCRSREQFYTLLRKQGYKMPSLNCNLSTLEWMYAVRAGHCYCPKDEDINRTKKCYDPPPIKDMISKLE